MLKIEFRRFTEMHSRILEHLKSRMEVIMELEPVKSSDYPFQDLASCLIHRTEHPSDIENRDHEVELRLGERTADWIAGNAYGEHMLPNEPRTLGPKAIIEALGGRNMDSLCTRLEIERALGSERFDRLPVRAREKLIQAWIVPPDHISLSTAGSSHPATIERVLLGILSSGRLRTALGCAAPVTAACRR